MRIFKNKAFNRWAAKEGLDDDALRATVDEMDRGLLDADLGEHVIKKRVAVGGRGKSGGVRTLLAYRAIKHSSCMASPRTVGLISALTS